MDIDLVRFGPRVDADFFPVDPSQMLAEAPKKATLLGAGTCESLSFGVVFACEKIFLNHFDAILHKLFFYLKKL